MVFIIFTTILLYMSLVVHAAAIVNDTGSLDPTILIQNAQQAQTLNTQFEALSLNDSCTAGQTACIYNNLANCVNGAWETTKCLSSQECFALPLVNTTGTVVRCTSEVSALSLMNATGVNGLFSSNMSANISTPANDAECGSDPIVSSSMPLPPSFTSTFSSTTSISSASPSTSLSSNKSGMEETFTITSYVPFNSAGVAVFPAVTQILGVADAQAVIASLVAGGGKLVSS